MARFARAIVCFQSLIILLLLCACQDVAAPQLLPTPAPARFTLLREALANGRSPGPEQVTLAGYVLTETAGDTLVSELIFDVNGTSHIPSSAVKPIWLGANVPQLAPLQLRVTGPNRYAPVLAHGVLQGPGTFGPDGRYSYQLTAPSLEPWVPSETNVGALLDGPAAYADRLVRVVGGLLLRDGSALLVDKLGPGGIPAQQARQIKLLGPIEDHALLSTLAQSSSGTVRFGQVQIEGVLRGSLLEPLAISPVR